MERSRAYLQQAVNQFRGMAILSGLKRKIAQPQKHDENEAHFGSDENDGVLSQVSYTAIALQNFYKDLTNHSPTTLLHPLSFNTQLQHLPFNILKSNRSL